MPRGVEMEVIAVEAVRLRAKHRAERPTGLAVHPAQRSACPPAAPIVDQRDAVPVGQREAGDVDGLAATVFADRPAGPMVAGTAGVMRGDSDLRDAAAPAADLRHRGTIDPPGEGAGGRAIQQRTLAQRYAVHGGDARPLRRCRRPPAGPSTAPTMSPSSRGSPHSPPRPPENAAPRNPRTPSSARSDRVGASAGPAPHPATTTSAASKAPASPHHVRAPEIRRVGVLPGFQDAAPDGTGAGEIGVQLLTVAGADRALQAKTAPR